MNIETPKPSEIVNSSFLNNYLQASFLELLKELKTLGATSITADFEGCGDSGCWEISTEGVPAKYINSVETHMDSLLEFLPGINFNCGGCHGHYSISIQDWVHSFYLVYPEENTGTVATIPIPLDEFSYLKFIEEHQDKPKILNTINLLRKYKKEGIRYLELYDFNDPLNIIIYGRNEIVNESEMTEIIIFFADLIENGYPDLDFDYLQCSFNFEVDMLTVTERTKNDVLEHDIQERLP